MPWPEGRGRELADAASASASVGLEESQESLC